MSPRRSVRCSIQISRRAFKVPIRLGAWIRPMARTADLWARSVSGLDTTLTRKGYRSCRSLQGSRKQGTGASAVFEGNLAPWSLKARASTARPPGAGARNGCLRALGLRTRADPPLRNGGDGGCNPRFLRRRFNLAPIAPLRSRPIRDGRALRGNFDHTTSRVRARTARRSKHTENTHAQAMEAGTPTSSRNANPADGDHSVR